MLFSNVFNGLTQVAKSVVGLIKGEQIEPVTYHEHDLQPLAPTIEPLLVTSEAIEEWRDYRWKYSDKCKVQVSSFGQVRIQHLNLDGIVEWKPVAVKWCNTTNVTRGSLYSGKLTGDSKSIRIRVDVAVLEAFVGRPAHLSQKMLPFRAIVHLDKNEKNCKLDNLRWITSKELDEKKSHLADLREKKRQVKLEKLKLASNKEDCHSKAESQDIQQHFEDLMDDIFGDTLDQKLIEEEQRKVNDRRIDKVISGVEKIQVNAKDRQMPIEKIEPKFYGGIDFQKALREEIWLPIPTFEGMYEVSSFGNVRSISRFVTRHRVVKTKNGTEEERVPYQYYQQGKRLKPSMMDGVLEISLSKGGKQSRLSIAKLVLVVFAKDKLESANFNVIHLNGNLNNCRLNNLMIADVATAA